MTNLEMFALIKSCAPDVNAFAALCQMNWETRNNGKPWTSELFVRAKNAAGLKKWSGWTGDVYEKVSWEQEANGIKVNRTSAFCKYPSIEAFLHNYNKKIALTYPVCVAQKDNFFGYFAGLFKGKYGAWATDQKYFDKLCSVAVSVAPQIFGGTWRDKVISALSYAKDKNYLSNVQWEMARRQMNSVVSEQRDIALKLVCVDFGHGGTDPGAVSGGVHESNVTRMVGEKVGKELLRGNLLAIMYSRVGDERVPLTERADRANRAGASVFVSLHCNAAGSPGDTKPNGFEVYTMTGSIPSSEKLAKYIAEEWRRAHPEQRQRGMMGLKKANFVVLRNTKMPAVLVEMGFLTNPDERALLINQEWQAQSARAIANAVMRFLSVRI